MRKQTPAISVVIAVLIGGHAIAQEQSPAIPLPQLERCDAATHPQLPAKWHAVFLMAPFTNSQLVLSEIEYDASLPATRVRLHGLRRGSLDLLITDPGTYVLSSQDGAIAACEKLDDTGWRPLPQDWL